MKNCRKLKQNQRDREKKNYKQAHTAAGYYEWSKVEWNE